MISVTKKPDAGFALLAALWTLTLAAGVTLEGATRLRATTAATENRIATTKAVWARRACVAALRAQHDTNHPRLEARLELGTAGGCHARDRNPGVRLNVNLQDSLTLHRALGEVGTAALLDWRDADDAPREAGAEADWYVQQRRPGPRNGPIVHLLELRRIRGFEQQAGLGEVLTVKGDGRVDVNRAPPDVLRALSVLTLEASDRILAWRGGGRRFNSVEDLGSALLSVGAIDSSTVSMLDQQLTFESNRRLVEVTGYGRPDSSGPVSKVNVALAEVDSRLIVLTVEPTR